MFLVLVRYVLRAAVRDRILIALLAALLAGTSLAIFMGSAAAVEKEAFAAVFAAGGLRFAGVFGLVLFVVFYVRRSFESRDVEFLLSRPVTRTQYLLSLSAAFSFLAVLTALAEGLCLSVLMPHFSAGALFWVASIAVENIIMVNAALFFSLVVSNAASSSLACLGFYALARMMGQILGIIDAGIDMPGGKILGFVMQAISVVTPRLDMMGQTSWLIYGPGDGPGYGFLAVQGLVFSALILTAARIDLTRRAF